MILKKFRRVGGEKLYSKENIINVLLSAVWNCNSSPCSYAARVKHKILFEQCKISTSELIDQASRNSRIWITLMVVVVVILGFWSLGLKRARFGGLSGTRRSTRFARYSNQSLAITLGAQGRRDELHFHMALSEKFMMFHFGRRFF